MPQRRADKREKRWNTSALPALFDGLTERNIARHRPSPVLISDALLLVKDWLG